MNNKVLVSNIQRYSIHDGDGIRTTIFFKGCPLKCAWCHNPETQSFKKELMLYEERCTGCGACERICKENAKRSKCTACGECIDYCINNAREICGKEYTITELMKEVLKDRAFYETSGGGVTLSGGEVLAQDGEFVEELMKKLKMNGITVYLDTSGYANYENIKRLLPYTDCFLYDIKLMDDDKHQKYMGVSNKLILDNLVRLSHDGGNIYLRLPVIGGVNDDLDNYLNMIEFIQENHVTPNRIKLLPYHNTGSSKYKRIDKCASTEFTVPSESLLENIKDLFTKAGYDCRIKG